ncbi:hypothetical protein WJX72_001611 [[Myrmecia] bisecta]|uniref:Plastid lipid-associated protein/fibrillin conserved domain-containing protein n=1 Tax=[Myrmecia] bisecta TaxID=41462 RepID=A0AAW1NYY5_9CHLO
MVAVSCTEAKAIAKEAKALSCGMEALRLSEQELRRFIADATDDAVPGVRALQGSLLWVYLDFGRTWAGNKDKGVHPREDAEALFKSKLLAPVSLVNVLVSMPPRAQDTGSADDRKEACGIDQLQQDLPRFANTAGYHLTLLFWEEFKYTASFVAVFVATQTVTPEDNMSIGQREQQVSALRGANVPRDCVEEALQKLTQPVPVHQPPPGPPSAIMAHELLAAGSVRAQEHFCQKCFKTMQGTLKELPAAPSIASGNAMKGPSSATVQGASQRSAAPLVSAVRSAAEQRRLRRQEGLRQAKQLLLYAIAGTQRGGAVSKSERGAITEAQVALEAFGGELNYELLEGTWRLIYTTALDVVPLLGFTDGNLLPLRVGDIYQRFSSVATGRVENIIKLSVPFLLKEGEGATVVVGADYTVRSPRRVALYFREAGVRDIHITPLAESLLAPALLPRGWLQHRLLLAIQEFAVTVPLRRQGRDSSPTSGRFGRGAGDYLLTFLDEEMLVGRAEGSAGTFIFVRDQGVPP